MDYDEDTDYGDYARERCLGYNAQRKLILTDLGDLNDVGALAALILSRTFLDIDDDIIQYVLSGYGSDFLQSGEALIGLDEGFRRVEVAKLAMLVHCLPVLNESTIPNTNINGGSMVEYKDIPRSGNAPSSMEQNIVYSIQFYNRMMRGTDAGYFEPSRVIQIQEILKPMTRGIELLRGYDMPRNDGLIPEAVLSLWSGEFYSKIAAEGTLDNLPGALQNPTAPVIRKNAFEFILDAIVIRGLYSGQSQSQVESLWN